jgi:hypothetical protein
MRISSEARCEAWNWLMAMPEQIASIASRRDADYAKMFMDDLANRLNNRVQLTTDGHKAYLNAIENAFGNQIDYAQLVKLYGAAPESAKGLYSPAKCTGIKKTAKIGEPDEKLVSTSYAERQKPHDADAHAPVHPADERLLEKVRKPLPYGRALYRLV